MGAWRTWRRPPTSSLLLDWWSCKRTRRRRRQVSWKIWLSNKRSRQNQRLLQAHDHHILNKFHVYQSTFLFGIYNLYKTIFVGTICLNYLNCFGLNETRSTKMSIACPTGWHLRFDYTCSDITIYWRNSCSLCSTAGTWIVVLWLALLNLEFVLFVQSVYWLCLLN